MTYHILYRLKRFDSIKYMKIDSDLPKSILEKMIRKNYRYRVLYCDTNEQVINHKKMGKENFLKCFHKYHEDLWIELIKIDA